MVKDQSKCELAHMELKQKVSELSEKVSILSIKVGEIPDTINDIFIKNGFDPNDYFENQETGSIIRKLKFYLKEFRSIWSKTISVLILYLVIVAFSFYYFSQQYDEKLIRNDDKTKKMIEEIINKEK